MLLTETKDEGKLYLIAFRTNKLKNCYLQYAKACRMWGKEVGRRYIQRVNIIKSARAMDNLYKMPELKCHPLKGDRKGQFSLSLTGFYRLIFTVQGKQLVVVTIEEVSKHYDD